MPHNAQEMERQLEELQQQKDELEMQLHSMRNNNAAHQQRSAAEIDEVSYLAKILLAARAVAWWTMHAQAFDLLLKRRPLIPSCSSLEIRSLFEMLLSICFLQGGLECQCANLSSKLACSDAYQSALYQSRC